MLSGNRFHFHSGFRFLVRYSTRLLGTGHSRHLFHRSFASLGLHKVHVQVVQNTIDLRGVIGKHHQLDLPLPGLVANGRVEQAMVFGFPRKFPHSILRDAEELEGPTLFQHSHQLGFSTNFLLIVQNCVHKKREILCRQPR